MKDCVFLNDPNDPNGLIRLLMPGGNAVFKMKNVFFGGAKQSGGEGVIMAPQVCSQVTINYILITFKFSTVVFMLIIKQLYHATCTMI